MLLAPSRGHSRKCCDHPYLFSGAEEDPDETSVEELVGASGKLRVLDRLLLLLHARRHRVVLFSQFSSMVDLLDDYCTMRGWSFVRLTGATNRVQRMVNLQAFNAPDSKVFLFLMTTRAGGLGINLQTADTCILFDSDWNPQCDLQAMARVHRLGQTKPVHIYRLVSGGTAEERVVQRAQKKLFLSETVNRGGERAGASDASELEGGAQEEGEAAEKLSGAEVLAMIKFGAASVFAGGNREPTDAELEAIIDRTRTGDETVGGEGGGARGGLVGGTQLDAASMERGGFATGPVQTRSLFGRSFELPKSQKDIGAEWRKIVEGQRARKNRIQMVASDGSGYGSKFVPVLASNNYSLEQGEGSVFSRELGGQAREAYVVPKRKLTIAGRDYAHETTCLACFVGDVCNGTGRCASASSSPSKSKAAGGAPLLGCRLCPMAFHSRCAQRLGCEEERGQVGGYSFTCPQHACKVCGRKAAAAGGMLFRCEACPATYCEDCLPREAEIVGSSARLLARGIKLPQQGCYVRCSARCQAAMARSAPAAAAAKEFGPLALEPIDAPLTEGDEEASGAGGGAPAAGMAVEGHGAGTRGAAAGGPDVAVDDGQRPAAEKTDGGEVSEGGTSFTRLFGSLMSSGVGGHAPSAAASAAFAADLKEVMLTVARENGVIEGGGQVVEDAAGHSTFLTCFMSSTGRPIKSPVARAHYFLRELCRRGKERGTTPEQTEALARAAVADGRLVTPRLVLPEGAAPLPGAYYYEASPALAVELAQTLSEEAAADEAALCELVERTREGIVRVAKLNAKLVPSARLPLLSIPTARFHTPSASPWCALGFDCSRCVGASGKASRYYRDHLCPLFRTEGERDRVRDVMARLIEDGTLCAVTRAGAILEAGGGAAGAQYDPNGSIQSQDVLGVTLPRTPDIEAYLLKVEAEAAAEARKAAAAVEAAEAERQRREAEARAKTAGLLARHPEIAAAGHDELVRLVKARLIPTVAEELAEGRLNQTDAAHSIGVFPDGILSRWLEPSYLSRPLDAAEVRRIDGLVRSWLTRRGPSPRVSYDEAALRTHNQLVEVLGRDHLVSGVGYQRASGVRQRHAGTWSQVALTRLLGVGPSAVGAWLRGQRTLDDKLRLWLCQQEGVYLIRAIVAERTAVGGQTEYHVQWEPDGTASSASVDMTWEPEENVEHTAALAEWRRVKEIEAEEEGEGADDDADDDDADASSPVAGRGGRRRAGGGSGGGSGRVHGAADTHNESEQSNDDSWVEASGSSTGSVWGSQPKRKQPARREQQLGGKKQRPAVLPAAFATVFGGEDDVDGPAAPVEDHVATGYSSSSALSHRELVQKLCMCSATQNVIAVASGVSAAQLSQWKTGKLALGTSQRVDEKMRAFFGRSGQSE